MARVSVVRGIVAFLAVFAVLISLIGTAGLLAGLIVYLISLAVP